LRATDATSDFVAVNGRRPRAGDVLVQDGEVFVYSDHLGASKWEVVGPVAEDVPNAVSFAIPNTPEVMEGTLDNCIALLLSTCTRGMLAVAEARKVGSLLRDMFLAARWRPPSAESLKALPGKVTAGLPDGADLVWNVQNVADVVTELETPGRDLIPLDVGGGCMVYIAPARCTFVSVTCNPEPEEPPCEKS